MDDWQADEAATISNCGPWCTALLWIVPAKVEGSWRLPQGDLTLTQSYQMLSGTFGSGSSATEIANGRLRGDQIMFDAGDAHFTGSVNGDTMEGTVTSGGRTGTWRASRTRR